MWLIYGWDVVLGKVLINTQWGATERTGLMTHKQVKTLEVIVTSSPFSCVLAASAFS